MHVTTWDSHIKNIPDRDDVIPSSIEVEPLGQGIYGRPPPVDGKEMLAISC
jgi:hypothetical protein